MKKKTNIILAVVAVLIIALLNGCGGKLRIPPWNEDEIKQMQFEEEKSLPLGKYEF
jgi:hypothetical protein